MQFSYLEQFFSKIEKLALPGKQAQALLAPEFRKELLEQNLDFPNAKRAGVLILLYPTSTGEVSFVLILRKTYKGVHSNQVAFPGGKAEDQDSTIVDTAIRETEEEIGVRASSIRILRQLTDLFIPPSNFLVYPTLGLIDYRPNFILQQEEVETIIEVNLEDFLNLSKIETHTISASYAHQQKVLAFEINGYVVWGATAMMLSEFKEFMRLALN